MEHLVQSNKVYRKRTLNQWRVL